VTDSKRPVLLIGSLNLADRTDVFDQVSARLRDDIRSVPDGETGDRATWVTWGTKHFEGMPELEKVDEMVFTSPVEGEFSHSILAPRDGVDLTQLDFGSLGYVGEATSSYAMFVADREAGRFADGTRFQVSMPTPMMFAMGFPSHRRQALVGLERALANEIQALLDVVPAEDLAIQWDVAGETQIQEQFLTGDHVWASDDVWPLEEVTESIARVSTHVPEAALLGIHFCYGDAEGEHLLQPRDLSVCVALANSASELIERRLDWIHMPVPIDRTDEAYYRPLQDLRLRPETQLYLGLLHKEDGVEGARTRIDRASAWVTDFGVATECGMGREPRDRVPELLDLHHHAASL
jgi:hypothetical protein